MKHPWLFLALTSVAHAGTVKPPEKWEADPQVAVRLSRSSAAFTHFDDRQSISTVEVYKSGVASLYVYRISASITGLDAAARDRAASAELAELPRAAKRANARVNAAKQGAAANGLQSSLEMSDDTTGVITLHQMVVAADEQQIVAVHGECISSLQADPALIGECRRALGSLDPGIAAERLVKLSLVAQPAEPSPAPEGSAKRGPSLVDSGERPSLPPMQIPQEPSEPDRRPIFVGFGLIVLALVFYWNRKNREKLERQYEKETADKSAATPERPAKSDRDADDLHAAAEADTKESKS